MGWGLFACSFHSNSFRNKILLSPQKWNRENKEAFFRYHNLSHGYFELRSELIERAVSGIMGVDLCREHTEKSSEKILIIFCLTFALFTGIQLEFMLDCSLKLPSNVSAISFFVSLFVLVFEAQRANESGTGDKSRRAKEKEKYWKMY